MTKIGKIISSSSIRTAFLLGFVLLVLICHEASPAKSQSIKVSRVIDGDTIVLSDGQKIRYIGINAPETKRTDKITKAMGEKAKIYNENLVLGKTIRLEFDIQQKDKYGRILAYVYVSDVFVNAELIRAGYASASAIPPNIQYADLFRRLETEARELKRGLWAR